jgi:hypothetical protein
VVGKAVINPLRGVPHPAVVSAARRLTRVSMASAAMWARRFATSAGSPTNSSSIGSD